MRQKGKEFSSKFLEPILLDLKKESSGTCDLSTLDAETGRILGSSRPGWSTK